MHMKLLQPAHSRKQKEEEEKNLQGVSLARLICRRVSDSVALTNELWKAVVERSAEEATAKRSRRHGGRRGARFEGQGHVGCRGNRIPRLLVYLIAASRSELVP